MNRSAPSDVEKSRSHWQGLYELLGQLGVDVRLMLSVHGQPDRVFTANVGLVWRDTVFVASYRHATHQDRAFLTSSVVEDPDSEAGVKLDSFEDDRDRIA